MTEPRFPRDANGTRGALDATTRDVVETAWPVDGGDLAGLEWSAADGAPVLLAVHGITANARSWSLVAERLPGMRVLAPDLRGRGRSNGLPGPWALDRHADDLAAVLDAAGVDRAFVAGHSMGGFVGARFVHRHPDRVEGLVLVDGGLPMPPLASLPDGSAPSPEAALGPAMTRLSMSFASLGEYYDFWREHPAFGPWWNDAIEAYLRADVAAGEDGRLRTRTVADAVLENVRELDGGGGYARDLEALGTPGVFIRCPRGLFDADPLYPASYAAEWTDRIPGLSTVEADGTNHYTITLAPHGADLTAAVIRALVDVGLARARARAAHPATGRIRIIRPVDPDSNPLTSL